MANYKWDWRWLIPGYGLYQMGKNLSNGYQRGDLSAGLFGFNDVRDDSSSNGVIDSASEILNDHNVSNTPDGNGYSQVEVTPSDPTSSASNVINHDPNKSSQENLLGYAQANNSASAYQQYLANQYNSEMANSAFSRAIADAEANGISKYQLFQSGNAAASTPSSGSSLASSYENAMNRRNSWNEKELAAITAIVVGAVSSAAKMLK